MFLSRFAETLYFLGDPVVIWSDDPTTSGLRTGGVPNPRSVYYRFGLPKISAMQSWVHVTSESRAQMIFGPDG
jgi:hypothetical protein